MFPDDDRNIGHEFISNLADDSPPVFDKDVWVDPVVDPQAKGKTIETNLPGSYQDGHMIHPLFVNCLLDKIHRMEVRVTEMVAHRDIMEAENIKLNEKVVLDNKSLLRLKKHKNRLIRRLLKL